MENRLTLQEIRLSIMNWDLARKNAQLPLLFFNNVAGFEITRAQADVLLAETERYVHVYPGIYNNELYFIMLGDKTDSKPVTDANLVCVTPGLPACNLRDIPDIIAAQSGNIETEKAYRRSLTWYLYKDNYFSNHDYESKELFYAFKIPVDDLKRDELFGVEQRCTATFALNYNEILYPEIIVWDGAMSLENRDVMDVSLPVPPFGSGESFALYDESRIR